MESFTALLSFQPTFPSHSSSSLLKGGGGGGGGCCCWRRISLSLITKAELQDSGDVPTSNDTKKPAGFGTAKDAQSSEKKIRGKVIRRSPIERPPLLYSAGQEEGRPSEAQQSMSESAFLLTWLGLGLLIFVEGIALAASGFLPEEWDSFFVKYLYPSFTPTVFLFVGGTVVYGVVKYLQGENMKG